MRRALPVTAVMVFAAISLAGCGSIPGSAPGAPVALAASKPFVMKVISVTATLEPYNPQTADQGIQAEEVSFVIPSSDLPTSCTIEVLRFGRTVGSTVVGIGPASASSGSVTEMVTVEGIMGGTFAGSPSNAYVFCPPATGTNLVIKVTSVSPFPEPFLTSSGSRGASIEKVSFIVRADGKALSCKIDVLRSGRTVASSEAGFTRRKTATGLITESVPVQITGPTFVGSPSNAYVFCRAS